MNSTTALITPRSVTVALVPFTKYPSNLLLSGGGNGCTVACPLPEPEPDVAVMLNIIGAVSL